MIDNFMNICFIKGNIFLPSGPIFGFLGNTEPKERCWNMTRLEELLRSTIEVELWVDWFTEGLAIPLAVIELK